MPDFRRLLSLPDLLSRKSIFLFGPRATGKSFLVREHLGTRALVIDWTIGVGTIRSRTGGRAISTKWTSFLGPQWRSKPKPHERSWPVTFEV